MSLTNAQKAALHADMLAHPELSTAMATGDDITLANFYNATANPAFIVWRTNVTKEEYQSNASPIGTLFNWAGTGGYIARSQGERDAWNTLFSATGFVDPSKPNIISAFNDIFSGSGSGAVNNKTHLIAMSKRNATVLEKLLSTGTGTDADPAVMGWEGVIGYAEISEARVWQ